MLFPEALMATPDAFVERHLGPRDAEQSEMLQVLGYASLEALSDAAVPDNIRVAGSLNLPPARGEREVLGEIRRIAGKNRFERCFIGMGYYGTFTPPVILRNVLENPGWYTQYTPYQAEIAQGRLEALLNFQTLICDLTGMPLANSSLLDEGTAAAEAMTLCRAAGKGSSSIFVVDENTHPQTLAVIRTRAEPQGIQVVVGDPGSLNYAALGAFAVLISYPGSDGRLTHPGPAIARARAAGVRVILATDLLALTLIESPGQLGADVAVGSSQRLGVPMGFGGPHAAFFATREELKRQIPGRIVGVSRDSEGRPAYRLSLQTREQHIRRERATSNICTAQVLLAIVASCYAVYHGPDGLRRIAERVHAMTAGFVEGLRRLGLPCASSSFFDTVRIALTPHQGDAVRAALRIRSLNVRHFDDGSLGVSFDETSTVDDVRDLLACFAEVEPSRAADLGPGPWPVASWLESVVGPQFPAELARTTAFLTHPVFNSHQGEHALLRYLHRLESKDLSLTTSMIPLGSCTMKLNATVEMIPITWPEFAGLHPFAPDEQAGGYAELFENLERWLAEVTGMDAVSLQPNSGAQGEYAGLLVIRAAHRNAGSAHRDVCLIPSSAHGTNPASAVMAGFRVVAVACNEQGAIDLADLNAKLREHGSRLAALMITYPSTHGVFDEGVREVCDRVHAAGGLVYLDGANMNAQVGLARPGDYGADVCHLNLHKTFAIPHGGGGPGMGPIAVKAALEPFLPGHPLKPRGPLSVGPVASSPHGSASILPISWAYIALMGPGGLRRASQVAILNANYLAERVKKNYPVLFVGKSGLCAHEFVADARPLKKLAGVEVDDVAKRLMDFGFHAPTMSWPVPGTLMIEPTESEGKAELDRLAEALNAIAEEAQAIARGALHPQNNPLKNAPHTALDVVRADWDRPYSREQAAFPAAASREHKYWPPVGRIDNAAGDRHLVCTCPAVEELEGQ